MSSHSQADRNLLFGIIALQMDFISRDQLIAAMQAWVFDKPKPLGQVLSEQGALSSEDHEAIEFLVRRHLLRHDNDPECSLAALTSIGRRLREDLSRIADPDLEASLPRVGAKGGDTESTLSYVGSPTTPGGRFRILRPHAQGGLGVVSVALDEELHREVALKEIQERYASDAQPRLRFLLEAEITGGLEHPGIVPVYGLGHHPDGRPFYAMRFVRGESLKEAVARYHGDPSRISPGSDVESADEPAGVSAGSRSKRRARGADATPLAFRRLLARFLDVCNAIAYAHSRGVLHRDIKPGNILLGPYGETLVVDWGLAKIIGRDEPGTGEPSTEPTLRPPSASGTGETIPGTALGTPAYMSPEQVEGRLDLLGAPSDVYGLGATLYVVLTGRAPFDGDHAAEILPKVQRGEFIRPRAVNPRIPKPLEAICIKAMAHKQADRYQTPRALAEDIEHWLADEPVSAYREPWPDRARRWSRTHRTLVTSAAAVLVLGLLGSVGFAAVVTGKNRELARQTQRAEAREQTAIGAVERFRDVVVEDPVLKNNPELAPLRKKLLKEPLAFFKSLCEQLQADNETTPQALSRLAGADFALASLAVEIGDREDARLSLERSIKIRERLARENPKVAGFQRDLANSHFEMGLVLRATGRTNQALESHGKALDIRERLTRENPRVIEFQSDLAHSHHGIGDLKRETGHLDQAVQSHGEALKIRERLVRENPSVTEFRRDLAGSHDAMGVLEFTAGHLDRALEACSRALAILERLASENHDVTDLERDLANAHNDVASLQRRMGHPREALESCGKALAIRERLVRENPSVTAFQKDLARTYIGLGNLQAASRHPDQALEFLGKALAIQQRLAREHPEAPDYASDLGASLNNMASIDLDAKRFDQARANLQQAISWQKKALASNGMHPTYRSLLQSHLKNLITAARALGKHEEVSAAERELDELKATDPTEVALDDRLAAVIRGEPAKDNRERLQLAYRAIDKKFHAASARLFAKSFEADPTLADDHRPPHRYNAACAGSSRRERHPHPAVPHQGGGENRPSRFEGCAARRARELLPHQSQGHNREFLPPRGGGHRWGGRDTTHRRRARQAPQPSAYLA